MFNIAKKILLTSNLIRQKSSFNFNNPSRIYDHDNNLIKYSYNNSTNKNEEVYEVDYINNVLSLKTDNARSIDDINKINNSIGNLYEDHDIFKKYIFELIYSLYCLNLNIVCFLI